MPELFKTTDFWLGWPIYEYRFKIFTFSGLFSEFYLIL